MSKTPPQVELTSLPFLSTGTTASTISCVLSRNWMQAKRMMWVSCKSLRADGARTRSRAIWGSRLLIKIGALIQKIKSSKWHWFVLMGQRQSRDLWLATSSSRWMASALEARTAPAIALLPASQKVGG